MYLDECYGAEETKKKLMDKEHIRFYEIQQIMAVKPNFTTISKSLLRDYLRGFRKEFKTPNLPFMLVQISGYGDNSPESTTDKILKISNHRLNNYDAVVNVTRDNQFRTINRLDSDTLYHEYAIKDQTAGDKIVKLLRLENSTTQSGTTETNIKIYNHGVLVRDWIRNNTRGWEARRVTKVLDEDTIVVTKITGQRSGDEIERYKFDGETVAKQTSFYSCSNFNMAYDLSYDA